MTKLYRGFGFAAIAAFSAQAAFADTQTAQECTAELSPMGKAIYEAVAPSVEADSDLKKLLKKKVRPLVLSGKLKRKNAKANAPLAGKCLLLLKQEKQSRSDT
jgi:hypothetical protein